MDKNTLSSFAWIIVTLMVMSVLIVAATPMGNIIQNGIMNFTDQYVNASTESGDAVDVPSFNLKIDYIVTDGGASNPVSYLSSMKKYSQYSVTPPQIKGYEPHIEVVEGILTSDTTLIVTYNKATYDIIYDLNAGTWVSGVPEFTEYTYGHTITLPDASKITRPHSTFDGWYTRSDFKGEKLLQISPSNMGDIKLYAKWNSQEYTITYDLNDKPTGASGQGYFYVSAEYNEDGGAKWDKNFLNASQTALKPEYTTYHAGESNFKFPTGVSKYGYNFKGWYTTKDCLPGTERTQITLSDTDNITLYAKWERKVYSIIYHTAFSRLNGNGSGKMLGISYKDAQYIITKSTGETVIGTGIPTTYTYGDKFNLPNNAYFTGYDGYITEEIWFNKELTQQIANINKTYVDANGITRNFAVGNIDIYVKPKPNNYYIVFDVNAYGLDYGYSIINGTMSKQKFTYDTEQKISPNVFDIDIYKFTGWNTRPDGTGISYNDNQKVLNLTHIQNEEIKLYAQWELNSVYVTFDINNPKTGAYTQNPPTIPYATKWYSFDDKITTMPGATCLCYTFDGWYTDSVGGTRITESMKLTKDMVNNNQGRYEITLYAHWSLNSGTNSCHNPYWKTTTEPTCTTTGEKTCTNCGAIGKIDALGHNWDTTKYEWFDVISCTASRTCKRCNQYEYETAYDTNNVSPFIANNGNQPTCTASTTRTYTAYFSVSWATSIKKNATIPKLGHLMSDFAELNTEQHESHCLRNGCSYQETENHTFEYLQYNWANNNSYCVASHMCTVCGVTIEETAVSKYTVVKAATSTTPGVGRYTVTFTNKGFTTQYIDVEIPISY